MWRVLRGGSTVQRPFAGKHVLITGGSEGLGLSLAKALAAQGAALTLVARTPAKLHSAREAAQAAAAAACSASPLLRPPHVYCHPADVTDYQQVCAAIDAAEAAHGPVDVLICCAGAAEPAYFHEADPRSLERAVQLNYLGSAYAARALVRRMLARNTGHIVFVASAMALMGMIGYCSYAPSKFAVRGLAESLRNELQGSGVCVSIAYPADIDTPGYARETAGKPWETAKLSEGVRLQSPDEVARKLLAGLASRRFLLPNSSFLVGLLQSITAGLVPRGMLSGLWEALLGALSPLICTAVAAEHDGVARSGAATRYATLWSAGSAAAEGTPEPAE